MDLGHRGAGHRHHVKLNEELIQPPAEAGFNHLLRQVGIKWGNLVLQERQFIGKIGRQKITAGRQHLTKFDKYRPKALQRQSKTDRQWLADPAGDGQYTQQHRYPAQGRMADKKIIEPVAIKCRKNFGSAHNPHDYLPGCARVGSTSAGIRLADRPQVFANAFPDVRHRPARRQPSS